MPGVNEFSKLQVGDGVRGVKDTSGARHARVFGRWRGVQLRVGYLEVINGLAPGKVATVHDVAPLKSTWVAREVQSKDMTLGHVADVSDVRRRLGNRAIHDTVDHVVSADGFFAGGAGVCLGVGAENKAREDCDMLQNGVHLKVSTTH